MIQRKYLPGEDEPMLDGAQFGPPMNVAQTVDNMIGKCGIEAAAQQAATVVRAARAMNNSESATDWEEVRRLILAYQRHL